MSFLGIDWGGLFGKDSPLGGILGVGIPAVMQAWGSASEGEANRKQRDDEWARSRDEQRYMDAQNFEQAKQLAMLNAALDKSGGSAVAAQKIRTEGELEAARRQSMAMAYKALMEAALQGGNNQANTLMQAGQNTQVFARNPYAR